MNTQEELATEHRNPTWGLPGTLLWGVLIAALFTLTHSIVIGVYISLYHQNVPSTELEALIQELQFNATVLSVGTFVALFACGLMIVCVIKLKKDSSLKEYLGLKAVDLITTRNWLLALFAFIFLSNATSVLLGKPVTPQFVLQLYQSAETMWILWLALVVAAPILEEIFFRGFLIAGLSSTFLRAHGAIVVTAALWAGIHSQYDLYNMSTIFLLGIMFGIARMKSGSVLLTIGLHALVNLVAIIEVALASN